MLRPGQLAIAMTRRFGATNKKALEELENFSQGQWHCTLWLGMGATLR